MPRALLVFCLMFALVSVGGCFNRPTEAVKKTEGGNFDRMKGDNPGNKGKRPAAGKAKTDPSVRPSTADSGGKGGKTSD